MYLRVALCVGIVGFWFAASAEGADAIKRLSGPTLNGSIKSMGKTEVTIEKTTGASETVPVIDIETIVFEGEPAQIKLARGSAANGSYAGALATLSKIDLGASPRPEIKQEMAFLKGYCMGKQAIETGNAAEMSAAASELFSFVNSSPSNYHALAAFELLG